MASRLWNQIHGVKSLQHGTFKIFSSHSVVSRGLRRHFLGLRGNPESGTRHFSDSKDLKSPAVEVARGRFIRNTPGPIKPSDAALRPSLRYRIKHGTQIVARNARSAYHHGRVHNKYRLRDGTGIPPNEQLIKLLRQEFKRDQFFSRYQPCFMIPFCSKNVECFEREEFRPAKFHIKKFSRRRMSTNAADVHSIEAVEEVVVEKKPSNTNSIQSNHSVLSQDSVVSLGSIGSIDSIGSIGSAAESVGSVASMAESTAPAGLSDESAPQNPVLSNQTMQAASATPETSHIGYGFTQLNKRKFSTLSRQAEPKPFLKTDLTQTRGLIPKCCDYDTDECPPKRGKKPKVPSKMCKDWTIKKKKKKERIYKHPYFDLWTKCEKEPERLDCDETTCIFVYPFPCPCDKFPEMCPIDCPPPCEHPPAPPTPLCRPSMCPVYQKIKEKCPVPCPKPLKPCVVKKKLRKIASPCKCVEPYMPCIMPPLKLDKKKAYQCTPECPPKCKPEDVVVVTPRKLPPIIPGDCPCVEPKICDVPPLRRLNMQAYQKIKECKPECKVVPNPVKCIPRGRLSKIKSDCVCIEPPPLKPVKLIRLPPICVCPEPPDPKCIPEKCPLRADDVCKWKYPKKKLKNFWCPNCKMPKSKYKFCVHAKKCKSCPAKKCNRRCMCTYSRANKIDAMHGLISTSILKPVTMSAQTQQRGFQTSSCSTSSSKARPMKPETLASLTGEKKRCPKKHGCPPLCGTVCCEPRARDSCEIKLPPLCCKAKRCPYPAFSEYGEFSEILTCECGHSMPYLQPTNQKGGELPIMNEPIPKFRIIDPVLEEHCVLNDLCRPKGHTYTCETFHQGEVVPITQYECFSPHRLPCCERDQICDFEFRPSERKCDGNKKDREFYRCECFCPKPIECPKAKRHKLDSVYSKIRKDAGKKGTRKYSTYSGLRRFSTFARKAIESHGPNKFATCSKNAVAGFHSTAVAMKRKKPRAGGASDCIDHCPFKCKQKVKCGKPMTGGRELLIFREMKAREKEMNSAISGKLKVHFKQSQECQGSRVRRRAQLAEAICMAERVGMKLVPDHRSGCKRKMHCSEDGIDPGPMCGPMPECLRPKNVCCPCDPRYEVDECRAKKWVADCCQMPYRMGGPEFRARQPKCCKMPIPVCNRDCMRVRATCDKEYVPCCVTESPFPAFSDCHPPFKRLVRSECQFQELMLDECRAKITKMLGPVSLARAGKGYCTATKAALTPINENGPIDTVQNDASVFDKIKALVNMDAPVAKGLHEPMNCNCSLCVSMRKAGARIIKPDLSARNVKQALPTNALDNIPDFLFTKDDIFEQVDGENLISLAPLEMTPLEKVKCFLFNKANYVNAAIPNLPVDGFDGFISPSPKVDSSIKNRNGVGSSRSYSTSKPAKKESEDVSEAVGDEPSQEEAQVKKVNQRDVITISKPTDLIFLLDDNKITINLSPKETKGEKVKVIPHPICTHIMLDSGELLSENQYNLMKTILPMKNRIYLPYGLSHEEYTALEQQSIKNMQEELEKMLMEKENS